MERLAAQPPDGEWEQASSDVTRSTDAEATEAIANGAFVPCGASFDEPPAAPFLCLRTKKKTACGRMTARGEEEQRSE